MPYKPDAYLLGPFEIAKDFYYFGQWREGQRHGVGKLFFPDKSYYYG